ncbi:hypothetical protein BGZ74_000384 [Mortierella antarctica]|nr:hypothetical protein BGZ74_000384 [Mortierella antarctica]
MVKKQGARSWALIGVVLVVQALSASAQSTAPLQGLVQRLLPRAYHKNFDFQIVPDITPSNPENKYDVFRVSNKNNAATGTRVLIEGTTVAALGRGLKYYLDQAAEIELAWTGDRFDELPRVPPPVPDVELDTKVTVTTGHVRGSFVPHRYYTNVVTFGYQFAFWDWKRWEHEIDWMLLNGINLLPAMVGQEYVTRQFFRNLGLTDQDLDSFFTGPVFQPWQRMGNLQGSWQHELLNTSTANELVYKNKFIDSQWALQQRILTRLREFGITAILPAFQGFVPQALPAKFPNAVFKKSSNWSGFPAEHTQVTYLLQTDPLFNNFTAQFLKLQQGLNGGYTSHYYLLDLYNELTPDCQTPACSRATTTSVTHALQSVDKDAVWAMQGWFLTNTTAWNPENTSAYFAGIKDANGTPFIMDLAAESKGLAVWDDTDGFYGNDFGWSALNNFGAAQGMFGKLPSIFSAPFEVYNKYPNMKGIGVTAESINNNEYVYSALLDLAWHNPKQPVNQAEHLAQFVRRRYGPNRASTTVQSAFATLSKTVWDAPAGQLSQSKSFVEKVPALNMYTGPTAWLGTVYNYNKTEVVGAWTKLVQAALIDNRSNVPKTFKFDLVDLTREVLLGSTVFPALHKNLVDAYTAKDIPKIRAAGRQVVALITDINTLLNSHRLFSFGANVRDARESIDPIARSGYVQFPASANGPSKAGYQQFLESNARDLVTWWGPNSGDLADYASKQWGGLLSSYYLPRWILFIEELEQAVAVGKEWDRDAYIAKTLVREAGWQKEVWGRKPGESWETNGQEPTEVVRELYHKWGATAVRVAAGGMA